MNTIIRRLVIEWGLTLITIVFVEISILMTFIFGLLNDNFTQYGIQLLILGTVHLYATHNKTSVEEKLSLLNTTIDKEIEKLKD